ncbi:MAG: hypothetical protein KGI80_02320 [Verrucomicrobiota bacterium]|nr:hypothetical protein [Verrucomicrobiota bacterium]
MGRFFFSLLLFLFGCLLGFQIGRQDMRRPIVGKASEAKEFVVLLHAQPDALKGDVLESVRSLLNQNYSAVRLLFFGDSAICQEIEQFCQGWRGYVFTCATDESLDMERTLRSALPLLTGSEIVIPLEAGDRLLHPAVLQRLNLLYQDPNLWLSAIHPVLFPSYEVDRSFRKLSPEMPSFTPLAFYAALLQESAGVEDYRQELLEMGKDHSCLVDEPLFLVNHECIEKQSASTLFAPFQ